MKKIITLAVALALGAGALSVTVRAQSPDPLQTVKAGDAEISLRYEPQPLTAETRTLFVIETVHQDGGNPRAYKSARVQIENSEGDMLGTFETLPSSEGDVQFEYTLPRDGGYTLALSFKQESGEAVDAVFSLQVGKSNGATPSRAAPWAGDPLAGLLDHPWAFAAIVAWAMVWKGLALWRAAQLQHKGWFVALLIMNTFGLVEIAYLVFTQQKLKAQGKL